MAVEILSLNPFYLRSSFLRTLRQDIFLVPCLNPFYLRSSFLRGTVGNLQRNNRLNPFYLRSSFLPLKDDVVEKYFLSQSLLFKVFVPSLQRNNPL